MTIFKVLIQIKQLFKNSRIVKNKQVYKSSFKIRILLNNYSIFTCIDYGVCNV